MTNTQQTPPPESRGDAPVSSERHSADGNSTSGTGVQPVLAPGQLGRGGVGGQEERPSPVRTIPRSPPHNVVPIPPLSPFMHSQSARSLSSSVGGGGVGGIGVNNLSDAASAALASRSMSARDVVHRSNSYHPSRHGLGGLHPPPTSPLLGGGGQRLRASSLSLPISNSSSVVVPTLSPGSAHHKLRSSPTSPSPRSSVSSSNAALLAGDGAIPVGLPFLPNLGAVSASAAAAAKAAADAAHENERSRAKSLENEERDHTSEQLHHALKRERAYSARLAADLAAMKSAAVSSQAESEMVEEGRINCLMRRLEGLYKEKGQILVELEREEEMLTNNLQKKLNEVRREKALLEKQIERENKQAAAEAAAVARAAVSAAASGASASSSSTTTTPTRTATETTSASTPSTA